MFISRFMEASKESEAPASFWFWSAMAALSAVVKRNAWIARPTWNTYPNIFIFLVADSGMRKGAAISLAKDLVSEVNNTRLISGRSSVQGIISALGTAYTLPDGTVIDKAYGFISASEFASSIVRDPDALTILTDLYDSCYHDKWTDTLRGGKVELREPSITLLAGINPPHFEDFISPTAIAGGFVGRLFLVFESEKARINPAVRKVETNFDKKELIKQLRDIAKVKGEMKWTERSLELYEEWYHAFETSRSKHKMKDKTGAINRVGENVLKIAILLSLSRSPDLNLIEEDIQRSIEVCTQSLSNVNKTTVGQGKSQFAPQTKLVITELISADGYELSRRKILSQNYGAIDSVDLDRVVDSLQQAGALTQYKKGNDICYKLTEVAIKQISGVRM